MDHERASTPSHRTVTEQARSVSHTSGPWIASDRHSEYASDSAESTWCVEQEYDDNFTIAVLVQDVSELRSTAEANARLIAAAPDMAAELSQLEIELQSFLDCDMSPTREWLQDNLASIQKVLAKAGVS